MPITSVPVISTKYNEFQFSSKNNPAYNDGEISSTCRYEGYFDIPEVATPAGNPTTILNISLYGNSQAIALSMQGNITSKQNIARTYFLYSTTIVSQISTFTNNHIETVGMGQSNTNFFYTYSDAFPWIEKTTSGGQPVLVFKLPLIASSAASVSGFYRLYQHVLNTP